MQPETSGLIFNETITHTHTNIYIYIYLNFTHELNKNKISFLDVLIDTNNNNFTTSTYKKPNNSCTLNFKSERHFRYIKKSNY